MSKTKLQEIAQTPKSVKIARSEPIQRETKKFTGFLRSLTNESKMPTIETMLLAQLEAKSRENEKEKEVSITLNNSALVEMFEIIRNIDEEDLNKIIEGIREKKITTKEEILDEMSKAKIGRYVDGAVRSTMDKPNPARDANVRKAMNKLKNPKTAEDGTENDDEVVEDISLIKKLAGIS